jgi:hypothetical protein
MQSATELLCLEIGGCVVSAKMRLKILHMQCLDAMDPQRSQLSELHFLLLYLIYVILYIWMHCLLPLILSSLWPFLIGLFLIYLLNLPMISCKKDIYLVDSSLYSNSDPVVNTSASTFIPSNSLL